MKIGNQNAGQITNVEKIEGNINFGGNNFNSSIELDTNINEVIKSLGFLNDLLEEKGLKNDVLNNKTKSFEKELITKSKKGLLNSFKEYVKELKEVTNNVEDVGKIYNKLLSIGGAIGKIITLMY